jgi:phosphatidylglycerol:prolipoprotein diacylglycerol transferase
MLYCAARFFLEFLRGDYADPVLWLFTSAQMTSITGFTLALICFIALQIKGHKDKKTDSTPKTESKV